MTDDMTSGGSPEPVVRKKSLIKQISEGICGHCRKPRGQHSKKNMMRCLYTSDYNLYHAVIKIQEMEKLLEELKKKVKEVKPKRKKVNKAIQSSESENLNAQAMGKDPVDVR